MFIPCRGFRVGKGSRMRADMHCPHSSVTGLFVHHEPHTGGLITHLLKIKIISSPNPVFRVSLAPDNGVSNYLITGHFRGSVRNTASHVMVGSCSDHFSFPKSHDWFANHSTAPR